MGRVSVWPVPNTACSSWLHNQCTTQLSPSAKLVAPLGERIYEKVENNAQREEERTKIVKKIRENTKVREGEGGIYCSPGKTHFGAAGHFWRSCDSWKAHIRAEENSEEEGVAERNCHALTIKHTHPNTYPTTAQSGESSVEQRSGKSGKRGIVLVVIFWLLLTTQISNKLH